MRLYAVIATAVLLQTTTAFASAGHGVKSVQASDSPYRRCEPGPKEEHCFWVYPKEKQ